jgi:hypothetical protein
LTNATSDVLQVARLVNELEEVEELEDEVVQEISQAEVERQRELGFPLTERQQEDDNQHRLEHLVTAYQQGGNGEKRHSRQHA